MRGKGGGAELALWAGSALVLLLSLYGAAYWWFVVPSGIRLSGQTIPFYVVDGEGGTEDALRYHQPMAWFFTPAHWVDANVVRRETWKPKR